MTDVDGVAVGPLPSQMAFVKAYALLLQILQLQRVLPGREAEDAD